MRAIRKYNHSVSIPANIPPPVVISVLHSYIPLMTTNPSITSFTEQPAHPSLMGDDPYFGPWDETIRCFQISDVVTLGPRLSKTIGYQVIFQAHPDGTRSRGNAPAGVVIRADYRVRARPGPTSPAGSDSTGSSATVVGEEYELNEELEVEANSLIMSIVADGAAFTHRHIVESVMEQIAKTYFGIPFPMPWANDGNGTWQRITPS